MQRFLYTSHPVYEWLTMVVAVVLLVAFSQTALFLQIERWSVELILWPQTYYAKVAEMVYQPLIFFTSKQELQQQVRDLQQKYAQSLVEVAQLKQLRQENEQLRMMVTSVSESRPIRITQPLVSYAQPSIVGGVNENIRIGEVVVWSNQLLGVVTEVGQGISRVTLLQDQSDLHILVKTETGVQGIIKGNGKTIQMTHVPVTEQLLEGQQVHTVGQERVPAELLVGVIGQIHVDPANPIQQATISQPLSFFEQDLVEIR